MAWTKVSSAISRYGRQRIVLPRLGVQLASLSTITPPHNSDRTFDNSAFLAALAVFGGLAVATTSASSFLQKHTQCESKDTFEHPHFTPAQVAKEEYPTGQEYDEMIDKFPVYTSDQVAENDGRDGKPVWMSYGGVVYDVTDFVANHPGGSEKVRMPRTRGEIFVLDLVTCLRDNFVSHF